MDEVTDRPEDGARAGVAPEGTAAQPAASSTTRALARAGVTVTALFALSRLLGYLRYVVIANAVPDPSQLDAFFAAFRIPDLLFQLVAAGALSSALIPVVAGLFATEQAARAWRVVSTVATLMLSVLVLLAGIVLLIAPQLVAVITPGFTEDELALTTELTRIMVAAPVFLAAGAVATSVLNARNRFAAAAVAPVVYNLAIILGALVLVPVLGVAGLAVSVVLGALGHLAVQVPSVVRLGARIRPAVDLRDAQARKAFLLMAPRALGLASTQVVFVVMTGLASTLPAGSIAVFNFAFAVLQIPIGVIGVPLGVVLLPSMSREAATGNLDAFRRLLVRGLSMLAWVMVVLTAIGVVLAQDITRLLFDYGSIGEAALELTGETLAVFLLGMTAHSLIAVLARAFYARQDTLTPVGAAVVAVLVDIALASVLVGPFGVPGLAAAIATGAWVELALLAVLMRRAMPGLGLGHVAWVLARTAVAAGAGAAAGWLVHGWLLGAWGEDPGPLLLLVRCAIVALAGGLVAVAASLALRIDEVRSIIGIVVDLLRRRGRA
jgi:putative peptidoglycan lipid II flippase